MSWKEVLQSHRHTTLKTHETAIRARLFPLLKQSAMSGHTQMSITIPGSLFHDLIKDNYPIVEAVEAICAREELKLELRMMPDCYLISWRTERAK